MKNIGDKRSILMSKIGRSIIKGLKQAIKYEKKKCPYREQVCIYDGDLEYVCRRFWEESRQDKNPSWERSILYCFEEDDCHYKK
jgi:hypothetical protein